MTFTEEVKLLPCPFCGGEAIFRYFPAPYDFQNNDQLMTIRVECSKCHVSTPKELEMRFHFAQNGQMPFLKDERKDIAVIWNRRPIYGGEIGGVPTCVGAE